MALHLGRGGLCLEVTPSTVSGRGRGALHGHATLAALGLLLANEGQTNGFAIRVIEEWLVKYRA